MARRRASMDHCARPPPTTANEDDGVNRIQLDAPHWVPSDTQIRFRKAEKKQNGTQHTRHILDHTIKEDYDLLPRSI